MTREEKQKAINALKISAPIMAVTQEEFNDYIQTLNKIMDWLEQEPIIDKMRAEIKALTSNRGFLSCSVDYIHEKIDAVFDKYKAESEDKE